MKDDDDDDDDDDDADGNDDCNMRGQVRYPPSTDEFMVEPWKDAKHGKEAVKFLQDTLVDIADFSQLHLPVDGLLLGYPPYVKNSQTSSKRVGGRCGRNKR